MHPIAISLLSAWLAVSVMASAPTAAAEPAAMRAPVSFLVIYRPGPAWAPGKPIRQQAPKAHGHYMLALFKQGKLTSAGPFEDDSGGAVVLAVTDAAEAEAIVMRDPAVIERVFDYTIHPWTQVPWQRYIKE